jgi:hypothetical protein
MKHPPATAIAVTTVEARSRSSPAMRFSSLLLLAAICLAATGVAADFVHPGVAHDAARLAFVRARVGAGQQPWADAWEKLRASREASLSWTPRPRAHVERGAYNNPNIGSSDFSNDAKAAYAHALCWNLTDEVAHARKSAEIVDAWSGTLQSVSNHDARLLVGMSGYHFTIAAELLKHTWDGWPAHRRERFARMAREIWYPVIKDFYPSANGNWDASMLQTMLAMGVFLDDQTMFDRARDYFLKGEGNGAIGNYFKPSGQCQESGRDQAHTQMGLDFLAATCETAWIQGVDLYGALDNRLLKGFEYTARYNLGHDVPYEPYRSFEGRYHYPSISDKARGRLRPMYERVFNHYQNRKGLDAPFTGLAVERLRGDAGQGGERRGRAEAALETLMFAGRPARFAADQTPDSTESLPPLADGRAPRTFEELWAGYDPRSEPLDVEVLKQWEEDGVVLRVLRYRIGIFKGRKAMMAAVYGHPKDGSDLPGLVQIHGGGQYAHFNTVLTNAKRGYATISLAWAGRIDAPGHRVTPAEVRLFWEGATNAPNYKLTTDWGALDGYHAPGRNEGNQFPSAKAAAWTLDTVESPRNSGWFLCALGARRALTFLERQPEVDPGRLGVYGHSMGGKLTVMTAADPRIKAAAPSCGGISDRDNTSALFRATLGDDVYLPKVSCPIVFLSPANDFHGHLSDLRKAVNEIRSGQWRVTCSPHHNHQDTPAYEVATQLWFDQHLKGAFEWPRTPRAELTLDTPDGVPFFIVRPDPARPLLAVDVFYTQQGHTDSDRDARVNRFWHHAAPAPAEGVWTARLPVFNTDAPLWVYANVLYPLDEQVTGAGYYYRTYHAEQFNISSLLQQVTPAALQSAGVKATLQPSRVIETFGPGWEKEWFTYRPEDWARRTHKVNDPQWAAPEDARLALGVRSEEANDLVVGLDDSAALVRLTGGKAWQEIVLKPSDFRNATGEARTDWAGLMELRLGSQETLRAGSGETRQSHGLGSAWSGPKPDFSRLRWLAAEEKGGS